MGDPRPPISITSSAATRTSVRLPPQKCWNLQLVVVHRARHRGRPAVLVETLRRLPAALRTAPVFRDGVGDALLRAWRRWRHWRHWRRRRPPCRRPGTNLGFLLLGLLTAA